MPYMVSSDVQILGAPVDEYVTMLGASSPQDVMCAEQVKGLLYASAGATLGTIGLGLFGVYKLFKGKPAAGVTGLVAGGISLAIGRVMAGTMAARFETCRAKAAGAPVPESPKLPAP